MQLAWFKSADIYIGQGLVMLKLHHETTHIFEHALTMPLERMLESCNGLIKKGTKFNVILSSSFCSALSVQIPASIQSPSELSAFLSASAARQLNAPNIQFDCEINSNRKSEKMSVVAAIPVNVRKTIEVWIQQLSCSMTSLRPLWAIATQFAACQDEKIKGFVLHEPDGSILLIETKNDEVQTMSWRGQLTTDAMRSNLHRAIVSFDMVEQSILSIQFSTKPKNVMANPPAVWRKHWAAI